MSDVAHITLWYGKSLNNTLSTEGEIWHLLHYGMEKVLTIHLALKERSGTYYTMVWKKS